jgi:hypothetical protein
MMIYSPAGTGKSKWGRIFILDFAIAKGMASGRIGVKFLFFTPAAKGAIGWSGCRPTGMKVEAWTVQIVQI